MIAVDASALLEVVADTGRAERVRRALAVDEDHAAPHVIDVEVLGVIRRYEQEGRLDPTAAAQATQDLAAWPGERFGHRSLVPRVWQLRQNLRGPDAFYVALAEALDATLVTLDRRLTRSPGPRCRFLVPDGH